MDLKRIIMPWLVVKNLTTSAVNCNYCTKTHQTLLSENSLNDMVKNLLPENRQDSFKPFTMNSLSSETLNEIGKLLAQNPDGSKDNILKLFSSRVFGSLIKDAMEQQWSMSPKDVAKDYNKIDRIYEKINSQLDRIEQAIKQAGGQSGQVSSLASEIKGNVNFMNQVNNLYTYVQIPLKMSGQNASGQLCVYTNKKNLQDTDKELSAFLHLDMDNMGSTDISIKLLHKNVDTKFYFDNDASYELFRQFLPQLDARLREKGCRITKQRLELLDVILNNQCSSCKEIHYLASKVDSGIGIATVYRMVNELEDIGVISRKIVYDRAMAV